MPDVTASTTAKHYQLQGNGTLSALESLAQATSLSKAALKMAAVKGAIWLSSDKRNPERIRRLKRVLQPNEQLDFYFNPEIQTIEPPAPKLILDRGDYSIWCKPRGMFSQGSKWGDFSALYRWSELYFQQLGSPRHSWIVHRLDRATRGLMIVAHTKKMAREFSQAFEKGEIHKYYQTNVEGKLLTQTPPEQFNTMAFVHQQDSKLEVTLPLEEKQTHSSFETLFYCEQENFSRLNVTLHTGRKHQIRQHLAYLGFPIIGDRFYGNADAQSIDLQLTAYRLQWNCPLQNRLETLELSEVDLDLENCASRVITPE